MATKVYGWSDDLIEFEGDVDGEVGYYCPDEPQGCLLIFSDGTVLRVKYGKPQGGIWEVAEVRRGNLLQRIEICTDADADPYSDVAHFGDGLKWCFAAKTWERVA